MHTVYNELQSSLPIELATQIETETADFSIVNANTDQNPNQTVLIIDIDDDMSLSDPDMDDITVYPESVFGIMGVGSGNNDHDRLTLDANRKTFGYTPEPGFHGRAQFGFHLFDGKEKGGLEVYTIEVSKGPAFTVSQGDEIIINGGFEDGTEVRTWEELDKPFSTSEDFYFISTHLGGSLQPTAMPFYWGNFLVYHSHDTHVLNAPLIQNGSNNFGFATHTTPREGTAINIIPDATVPNNDRYIAMSTGNFMSLKDHLIPGEFYELTFILGFTANSSNSPNIGDPIDLDIELIEAPTGVYQANTIQIVDYETIVQNLLPPVSSTPWHNAEVIFQFCGNVDEVLHINIRRDPLAPIFRINLDNVSLKQVISSELEVDAGPDLMVNSSCPEVQLGASVLGEVDWCPLIYSWTPGFSLDDPSSQFPIANPSQTTTYTVTVTEPISGIQATDQITVIVGEDLENYGPVIICANDGSFDLLDIVNIPGGNFVLIFEGQQFNLGTNSIIDPSSLGFGEGTVLYTIENGDCNLSTFFNLTVQGYDSNNASHPDGLVLGSSQTLSGNYQFLDDLIIEDGATVTFDNSELQFSENARVHIEPGGRLNLNNCTLKELDCGTFWQGIYVEGISSISQYGSESLLQGRLELFNSTVQNALRGVVNYGQANVVSSHGGIIRTMDSQFINCEIAAEIKRYNNIHPVSGQHLDIKCRFYNTDFYIDENYQFVMSVGNPVMKLQQVKGVLISGCNFLNTNSDLFTPPNNSPQKAAIWSNWKTSFKITQGCNGYPPYAYNVSDGSCATGDVSTSIRGFNYGIYNIGDYPSVIDEVTFECYRGVWSRSKSLRLTRNNFRPITNALLPFVGQDDGPDPNWDVPYGAYLDKSTLFWLEGNSFNYTGNPGREVGLFVKSSGSGTHTVFRNTFTNTWVGSLAYDDNRGLNTTSGLNYECNTMSGSTVDIVVFPSVPDPDPDWGISEWQGDQQASKSAANDFLTNSLFNLYNDLDGNVVYFHSPSENFQTYVGNVQPIGSGGFDNACESSFPSGDIVIGGLLAQEKAAVDSTENLLYQLVDGGNTAALTTEVVIAEYSEALELYYELMDYSPGLSEEVLTEAINKEFDLPAPLLTLILQSNPHAAKSSKIQNELDQRMYPLDVYQREMINEGLDLVSYKEQLEASISYHKTRANFLLNRSIHEIIADTSEINKLQAIVDAVDGYRTPDHYYLVVDLYLQRGQIAQAQNMLNKVGQHFNLDERKAAEYTDYQSIYSILFNMESNNLDSLSGAEIQLVEEIAYKKSTLASGLAMNVLSAYSGQEFREVLVEPYFDSDGKSNKAKQTKLIYPKEISLYPNPSRGLVFVKGFAGEDLTAEIYNALGIKIRQLNLNSTGGIIALSGLPAGMYNITIREVAGQVLIKERVILVN